MASEATLKMILLGVDKGATRLLHKAGDESERSGSKMAKFGKVGKFAAAGVAAGLVAAAGAAVEFGRKSIDAYRDAAKESSMLSRTTGLTIKQASQLRFAAEETGTEFKTLSTSTRIFSKNVSIAGADSKKTAAMVKMLGFNFKGANGQLLPMSKLLPKVADHFKKMPDGPQKTALAMKLFGKSGADMLKLLNQGSDGLKKFAEEADRTGNSLSNVDSYKEQLKAQREFHASITGLKIQLGQALYPALTAISQTLATKVGPAITKLLPDVKKFGEWIQQNVVPAVRELSEKYLTGLSNGFQNLQPHLVKLKPFLTIVGNIIKDVLVPALGTLYKVVLPAVGLALGALAEWLGLVGRVGTALWNNHLQPTFKFIVNGIGWVLTGLSKFFAALGHVPHMGWAKKVASDLKNAAQGAHDLADGIRKIPGHKAVTITVTTKNIGVLNPSINKPRGHSATGSHINQSGFYDVGEVGRETVFLPRGAQVQSTASGQREAAQMAGGTVVHNTFDLSGMVGDKSGLARTIIDALKTHGLNTGTLVTT